jgi:predicted 3-demethylubiquinone-9 3-methyltransferase (glyoxalase superfamily)
MCWQIVPTELASVLADADPESANRAMRAMMTMKKLDIRAMKEAADGTAGPLR